MANASIITYELQMITAYGGGKWTCMAFLMHSSANKAGVERWVTIPPYPAGQRSPVSRGKAASESRLFTLRARLKSTEAEELTSPRQLRIMAGYFRHLATRPTLPNTAGRPVRTGPTAARLAWRPAVRRIWPRTHTAGHSPVFGPASARI